MKKKEMPMKTGCTFSLDEAVRILYKGKLKKEEALKSINEENLGTGK